MKEPTITTEVLSLDREIDKNIKSLRPLEKKRMMLIRKWNYPELIKTEAEIYTIKLKNDTLFDNIISILKNQTTQP